MNLYAIAARSEADIKTVRKWLNPELRKTMKPAVCRRVARAAVECGYSDPQDSQPQKVA